MPTGAVRPSTELRTVTAAQSTEPCQRRHPPSCNEHEQTVAHHNHHGPPAHINHVDPPPLRRARWHRGRPQKGRKDFYTHSFTHPLSLKAAHPVKDSKYSTFAARKPYVDTVRSLSSNGTPPGVYSYCTVECLTLHAATYTFWNLLRNRHRPRTRHTCEFAMRPYCPTRPLWSVCNQSVIKATSACCGHRHTGSFGP